VVQCTSQVGINFVVVDLEKCEKHDNEESDHALSIINFKAMEPHSRMNVTTYTHSGIMY